MSAARGVIEAPEHWFDGVHLMAPSLEDLHSIAADLGMPRSWFQDHPRHPHYDVWGHRARRLQVNCSSREMLRAYGTILSGWKPDLR